METVPKTSSLTQNKGPSFAQLLPREQPWVHSCVLMGLAGPASLWSLSGISFPLVPRRGDTHQCPFWVSDPWELCVAHPPAPQLTFPPATAPCTLPLLATSAPAAWQ